MVKASRTKLLALLLIVAGMAMLLGTRRLSASRTSAGASERALQIAQNQLSQLHRWRTGSDASPGEAPDISALNRLLRLAAADAGAADALVGIEPGQPGNLASGYTQLPVFLRLESLPLKQLTLFLHRLATVDPSSRAQSIELSPAGMRDSMELWNADITIVYMNYLPQE